MLAMASWPCFTSGFLTCHLMSRNRLDLPWWGYCSLRRGPVFLKSLLAFSFVAGSPWRVGSPWASLRRAWGRVTWVPSRTHSPQAHHGEWARLELAVARLALVKMMTFWLQLAMPSPLARYGELTFAQMGRVRYKMHTRAFVHIFLAFP